MCSVRLASSERSVGSCAREFHAHVSSGHFKPRMLLDSPYVYLASPQGTGREHRPGYTRTISRRGRSHDIALAPAVVTIVRRRAAMMTNVAPPIGQSAGCSWRSSASWRNTSRGSHVVSRRTPTQTSNNVGGNSSPLMASPTRVRELSYPPPRRHAPESDHAPRQALPRTSEFRIPNSVLVEVDDTRHLITTTANMKRARTTTATAHWGLSTVITWSRNSAMGIKVATASKSENLQESQAGVGVRLLHTGLSTHASAHTDATNSTQITLKEGEHMQKWGVPQRNKGASDLTAGRTLVGPPRPPPPTPLPRRMQRLHLLYKSTMG